ncbi:hypothetical protein ABR738_30615 [Streptomyces sp. Edi4]|uniref:WD40 repeat domain-containing protein n=1 Tax=Streptomyces sp. Edi4 TaxID=3162527 RepID=UPI0033064356
MIQHRGPISGVAAHKDTFVATAGYDNQVILWRADDKTPLARATHDHLANQVVFSPDGRHLLTSSSDYTARLWSVPDLKLLAVFSDHDDDVEMAVFHPTEPLVATASRDHRVRVYGFDGRLRHVFAGHTADVISVAWSHPGPGGSEAELVSSSDDGTIRRWSPATGGPVGEIDLGGVETDTVALAADGTTYAGNDEGQIIVIDEHGTHLHPAHEAGIKRLVLQSANGLLVSLSYDRTMRVWDTADGLRPIASAALPSEVWPRSCAFLGDSTLVFATFGSSYATYRIDQESWDLQGVEPTGGVNAVIQRGGATLAIGDAGILREDGQERTRLGSLCNFLVQVGERVLTGGQMGVLFDALTGEALHQHRSPLNCGAAFTREGRPHVVIGAYTGEGLVFSLDDDGKLVFERTLPLHANAVKDVAVFDDVIFSVCADTGAAWFSTADFTETARLDAAHDRIANGCAALGPGCFASISRDLRLRIWTGTSARTLTTPHDHSVKCVAASSDGRLIATAAYNGLVAVYDRDSDRWPVVVRPTTAGISCLHFDADRRRWLAGSYDGSVYEIPVATG